MPLSNIKLYLNVALNVYKCGIEYVFECDIKVFEISPGQTLRTSIFVSSRKKKHMWLFSLSK